MSHTPNESKAAVPDLEIGDGEIISHHEMCGREGAALQKGMNFFADRGHSVLLMSLQPNAPYADQITDEGRTLIYEGHDTPRRAGGPDPKTVDQPRFNPSGSLTENGRFFNAALEHARHGKEPRLVRVYEKLRKGIWSYNGLCVLQDAWEESDGTRQVLKFRLRLAEGPEAGSGPEFHQSRLIPQPVKLEVWKRDRGLCVKCGAADGLHFDHVLAYSLGGSSVSSENIQLLCARHNFEKGARIE